jgi:spermidine/putrescine transport system permease protein
MLPMTMPGVVAGCILVFIPAIGTYVTSDLLGGTRGLMIGNLIDSHNMGNPAIGRPVVASTGAQPTFMGGGGMGFRAAGRVGLLVAPLVSYFFLWAPILLLVLFSFNDSRGVDQWRGFTFRWYQNIFSGVVGGEARFATELMVQALVNTLVVGIAATLIATVLGTMIALSLSRSRIPGKRVIDGLMLLPVIIPEITQAVSLAIFFNLVFDFVNTTSGGDLRAGPGFGSIIIGHVVFNISYVAVVVRARLANMNPRLEEADNDLGANTWQTFRRITLPLIMPGVIAGALLAFTLSMDDLVVTFFNAGPGNTTLPVFVYGLIKTSVTPEVNALSTLMLGFSTIIVGVSLYLQNKYAERPYVRT